ncbi:hypothetical protein DFJ77DRAFT_189111 [Powellomyces hirtus]|nr:hypothetical protein DFJ77DRAFT_189111 [Powellomyces hirtus]
MSSRTSPSVLHDGKTRTETARRFVYPRGTVSNIVEKFERTGNPRRSHCQQYGENPPLTGQGTDGGNECAFWNLDCDANCMCASEQKKSNHYRLKLLRIELDDSNSKARKAQETGKAVGHSTIWTESYHLRRRISSPRCPCHMYALGFEEFVREDVRPAILITQSK